MKSNCICMKEKTILFVVHRKCSKDSMIIFGKVSYMIIQALTNISSLA